MDDKCHDDTDDVTSQELPSALEEVEKFSKDAISYYCICEVPHDNPLSGLFFAAKTPHGAIARIYQYMQNNKIPLWTGLMMGQQSSDITDLVYGEPISKLSRFLDLCDDWVTDYTVVFPRIEVV